jgi:IS30 family transposase
MPRYVSRSSSRLFWLAIRSGRSCEEAAADVGVAARTGWKWLVKGGGMPPLQLVVKAGRNLGLVERELILEGLNNGSSYRQIGRSIGRPASTVTRELEVNRRDLHLAPAVPKGRRSGTRGPVPAGFNYSPGLAQSRFEARLARPKVSKVAASDRLRKEVEARLKTKHSPEQISAGLLIDFPDNEEMRVSPEAIYRSLYVQGKGALKRELTACLRTGRALRKPRRQPGQRRRRIPDMVNIAERPAEVADRAVPGHWEGDLITGENNASAIGTLVERTTRFTLLLHLPDDHGAVAVRDAITAQMSRLPQLLRQTLTWDQGIELTRHAEITAALDLDIYFCDPHSPWQRGTNENTNGLLRQYFPKGTDLSGYHPDYLDFVAAELNDRPRKTLGWRTPAQALHRLLSDPPNPSVAMTG